MSATFQQIIDWIEGRSQALFRTPRMWGSYEAVEMQALLLAELRAFLVNPERERTDPRRVLAAYFKHLRAAFPGVPDQPLHIHVRDDEPRFVQVLGAFLSTIADARTPSIADDSSVEIRFPVRRLVHAKLARESRDSIAPSAT